MNDKLKAAVERAYAHAFSRYGLKEGAPIYHIIRALADEPVVVKELRTGSGVYDSDLYYSDVVKLLHRLAEIVK